MHEKGCSIIQTFTVKDKKKKINTRIIIKRAMSIRHKKLKRDGQRC